MDKYFRSLTPTCLPEFLKFVVYSWELSEKKPLCITHSDWKRNTSNEFVTGLFQEREKYGQSMVSLFGRDLHNRSICVHIPFYHRIILEVKDSSSNRYVQWYLNDYFSKQVPYYNTNKVTWRFFDHYKSDKFYVDEESKVPQYQNFQFLEIYTYNKSLKYNVLRALRKSSGLKIDIVQHESFVPPVAQFLNTHNMSPSCAYQFSRYRQLTGQNRMTFCDIEVFLPYQPKQPTPFIKIDMVSNVRPSVLSFDIEALPHKEKDGSLKFPNANNMSNPIICICMIFRDCDGQVFKYSLSLEDHIPCSGGVEKYVFENEANLLEAFRDLVVLLQVDIFIHYNGDMFDWSYMYTRAQKLCPHGRFAYFGKLCTLKTHIKEVHFQNKAHGSQLSKRPRLYGIINLDVYTVIRRGNYKKLDSYRLNNVANEFLQHTKLDLPIPLMTEHWLSGDMKLRQQVIEYCVRDSELPLELVDKLNIISDILEMASITGVFMQQLLVRGQMFKVLCQLFIFARRMNFVLGNQHKGSDDLTSFQGACVLPVLSGVYDNVNTLDFQSLYPSIIRSMNFCFASRVMNTSFRHPHIKYVDVKCEGRTYTFQQTLPGILPQMITVLLTARSKTKRLMKKALKNQDTQLAKILNSRQLAYKISANSMYGFTGAPTSKYPSLPIAACVTAIGRQMIHISKEIAEDKKNGWTVVAGDTDSIFTYKPNITLQQAFDLGNELALSISTQLQQKFGAYIFLEFEKCYDTLILIVKKHYVGRAFLTVDGKGKIDAKGVAGKRRSFPPWARDVFWKVVNNLLVQKNVQMAIDTMVSEFEQLLKKVVPLHKLVLTTKLAKNYKNPERSIPYIIQQQLLTNTGIAPQPGERVQYVIIVSDTLDSKCALYKKVCALKLLERKPIDYTYYIKTLKHTMHLLFRGYNIDINPLFKKILGKSYAITHNMAILSGHTINSRILVRQAKNSRKTKMKQLKLC
jgi:DNA polymerase elongation subunit (family B)